jgi:hypothetical protein
LQPELGSRFYLKLIIDWRPIVKKYSNGKVKRTLKKGLKVLEMVKRERNKNYLNRKELLMNILFIQILKRSKIYFLFKIKFEMTYYHYGIRWKKEVIIDNNL